VISAIVSLVTRGEAEDTERGDTVIINPGSLSSDRQEFRNEVGKANFDSVDVCVKIAVFTEARNYTDIQVSAPKK
jgi:hypothetical protein